MLENGVFGVGLAARPVAPDLGDLGAHLDDLKALGCDFVELQVYDMDLIHNGRIHKPQLEALKAATAGRGLAYSAHGPLAINFMDEPWRLPHHMAVLRASIEICAEVGARNHVLHTGVLPIQQAAGLEAAYGRQREALAEAGDFAREHGVTLCVETLFGDYTGAIHTAQPAKLAAELAAIDHPAVRATIDFAHSWLRADLLGDREGFLAGIKALAPFADHLHLHDNFGRQDDMWMYNASERLAYGLGDLHLPVGWGDVPWEAIMAECRFPEGVHFAIELEPRYWHAADECLKRTRELAGKARTAALA